MVSDVGRGLVFTLEEVHIMELERHVLLLEDGRHTERAGGCRGTVQLQNHSVALWWMSGKD